MALRQGKVLFSDVDLSGVIFTPNQAKICIETFVEWLDSQNLPCQYLFKKGLAMPIRALNAECLQMMQLGDSYTVHLYLDSIKTTSFTLYYEISVHAGIAAKYHITHVVVGKDGQKKPLFDELHVALESLPKRA